MGAIPRQLGLIRRDKGMLLVKESAGPEWVDEAEKVIHKLSTELSTFTSDDIWAAGLSRPKNSKALGPVLTSVARAGVIEATGDFRQTTQASRNGAPVRVWRSLIRLEEF